VSLQTWQETLITSQVDGSALASSTTATSLLPPAARYTLPANYLQIGRMFRIKFAGRLSNIVTTPGTITLDVRMGPTSNIVVFNGGAMQMSTTAHTNVPIVGEVMLTCRAIGNSTNANFMGQGWALSQALSLTAVADSTTTPAHLLMPNTAPAVGTGFDSTVAMVIDLYGTFSVNNAGNSITIHQYSLEAVN
jgi:hypothetical protein